MGTASWVRFNPLQLAIGGKGKQATMLMAVAAKKHVTIFSRSRYAPHAGHIDVKNAFAAAAKGTVGILDRTERNARVSQAVKGKGPGYTIKKSRSKAHPGKVIAKIPTR